MIKYPLFFKAVASASSHVSQNWSSSASDLSPIDCAIPAEFNGPGSGFSPEDLMMMAIMNCYIATFKVFAEHAKFSFSEIETSGVLEINRLSGGTVGVASAKIDVILKGVNDKEKAKTLLEEARKNCLMSNALKTPAEFNFSIS